SASHPDDVVRVHSGLRPAVDRLGIRRRRAANPRHGSDRGHAACDEHRHLSHPGDVLCRGTADGKTHSEGPRVKKRLVIAALAASLVTGCLLGPNYRRPAVTTPDVFRGAETTPPADLTSLADLKW